MMNSGLYIHIPFCVKKCNYCDFVSFESGCQKDYFECLNKEIELYSDFFNSYNIDTVFIGGGTPSAVNSCYIEKILQNIKVDDNAEITIEVNPGTLSIEKLKAYKKAGINRISIGLQSANDNELKILGRIHTYEDFLRSYEMIVNAGFTNINTDIMFGIPNQTLDSFKNTLSEVKKLNPTHISAYSLIIEENTPFGRMELDLPDEETDRAMYECLNTELLGYQKYEISNFAKPGYECRHNIKYWQMENYLGIGLNSHSFINGRRFSNTSDLNFYMNNLNNAILPVIESEYETDEELIKDTVITGLRMCKGINLNSIDRRFKINFYEKYKKIIDKYTSMNLLVYKNGNLYFSEEGFSVSNYILSDFM